MSVPPSMTPDEVEAERKRLRESVEGWRNRLWVMEHVELPKPSAKEIAVVRRNLETAERYLGQFEGEHREQF